MLWMIVPVTMARHGLLSLLPQMSVQLAQYGRQLSAFLGCKNGKNILLRLAVVPQALGQSPSGLGEPNIAQPPVAGVRLPADSALGLRLLDQLIERCLLYTSDWRRKL